jgi:hypothetical protein
MPSQSTPTWSWQLVAAHGQAVAAFRSSDNNGALYLPSRLVDAASGDLF